VEAQTGASDVKYLVLHRGSFRFQIFLGFWLRFQGASPSDEGELENSGRFQHDAERKTTLLFFLGVLAMARRFQYPATAMPRICVYSGSSFGASPEYAKAAAAFATACVQRDLGVVYGGSSAGLMGVLADAALAAGGEVIGVMPHTMIAEERAHRGLSQLIVVESMHQRKHRMAQLSDFFVALPGGIGTLEEVIEIFTWLQLGLHLNPVGLLNVCGFYDPLLRLLDHLRNEQFLTPAHRAMLTVERDSESLLERLAGIKHAHIPKSPAGGSGKQGKGEFRTEDD
jgi:uncharacterized protein (TIGR00730 family)